MDQSGQTEHQNEKHLHMVERISQQIKAVQMQADGLRAAYSMGDTTSDTNPMLQTLEKLLAALEELHVAQEELAIQNEELVATRQHVENQRYRYQDLFENAPDAYLVTDLKGVIREANHVAANMLNVPRRFLPGKPFLLYLSEADRVNFQDRLLDPESFRGYLKEWEVQLYPRHRPELPVSLTTTLIDDETGVPAAVRWLLRDISSRKEMESTLRDLNMHLEMRVRERTELLEIETSLKDRALARAQAARLEAEVLRDIGNTLNSSLELPEVLEKILDNVGRLVHHDGAGIMLLQADKVRPAMCRGYPLCRDEEEIRRLHFSLDHAFPLNEIARTGQPYIMEQVEAPFDWIAAMGMTNAPFSYMGVPIFVQAELIGFLNLTSTVPHYYTSDQLEVLQPFATQAALALQNARLYQQARTATILEERQRLARDLHDAVSQSLFTSTIVAEALLQSKETRSKRLNDQLEYLLRLNRGAQAEMRSLLLELRPAHLTDVDLSRQIRGLVESVRGRKEIDIELYIDDGVPMPPDVQIAFYRIAQEALNNIVKHSRAKKAKVSLISDNQHVGLVVRDYGRGIDEEKQNKGMGLSTMRERAEEIGADFEIVNMPGEGLTVTAMWMRDTRDEEEHE